ncbi:hypothetical protein L1286_17210 [Pseudoalteromonas sp. SMS1]|uniref:hypothetical protein n=1 Tax=Pseudoalteromonas sp. SMS1 TaxID=2908894 RepID=UPI001F29936A|nr:hypothetical protein [Pseudoalteromonas sp. SMS1]MCF2859225.1 hypothetical protein [Pseudoalteromonas sp. SMS1]
MKKLLQYSSVAIVVSMASSALAADISIPKNTSEPVSIYDFPGTYFDSNEVRPADGNSTTRTIPFQIQHLPNPNAAFGTLGEHAFSTVSTQPQTPSLQERSGCPELGVDNAIYASFSQPGDIVCFSTEVTTATKLEGLLVNIPQAVDYNLYLFKLEDDNSLTPLDTSTATASTSEQVVHKVDPGAYVLVAQSVTGTSTDQSIMAWFAHTEFDALEANDKPGQATNLPTNGKLTGNIDNQNDLDYFVYRTGDNQSKLSFNFAASDQFSLELWNGAGWTKLPNNQLSNIDVTPNINAIFLVKGVQANLPPTSSQYSFAISDPLSGKTFTGLRTYNNEVLTNLLAPNLIEAHQELGMSGTVIDTNGVPVPYGIVSLAADNINDPASPRSLANEVVQADENGKFNKVLALPDCTGASTTTRDNRVTRGTATRPELEWSISWDKGMYTYRAPRSSQPVQVAFAHICKEKIIKSCYWDRDFASGEDKYICNRF